MIYIVLFVLVVIFAVAPIRRALVMRFLLAMMKKKMPSISATEQEAIDAGTVWWEKSLFRGQPDWHALDQVQPAILSEPEQSFMDNQVETLCGLIDDWQTHQDGDLSQAVWNYMKQEKFFGMGIPTSYGGLAFSPTAHSEVIQKISSRSVTAAVTVMVPNSLGPAELLLHYGTKAQKDHYLPRLAVGEEVPCFALTAPKSGSDAGAMADTGVVEKGVFEGEEVLGIRLNFDKRYITLAPVATLVGLAFRLQDPNHLLGDQEEIGITVALIPVGTKGLEVGLRHNPLYIPFQNGPVRGKDVFIPMDFVVGGEKYVGQGWRMLMESLAAGRSISLPALSCGTGKMACAVTSAYAKVREQFGISIGRFEGVSEHVGHIVLTTYMVNAVRKLSARAVDLGERPSVLSAIAKYNTTETMRQSINDAMDVVGGKGIIVGPKNMLAHTYMAIPIGITVEGANILTRSMIVFGQGSIRSNPHVLAEIEAMYNPDKRQGVMQFDKAFFAHIYSLFVGKFRALRFVWFGFVPSRVPRSKLSRSYHHINRLSALFSWVADWSLVILGGKLKFKESFSGRMADALSGLYQASAVLKWYADRDEPDAERLVAQAAVNHELYRVEQTLDAALRNYPYAWLGNVWRWSLFPFGLKHHAVSDDVLHELTTAVMQNGELRQTLVDGVFVPANEDEAMGQLEAALQATLACEPMVMKLREKYGRKAVKVVTIADTVKQAVADGILQKDEGKQLEHWLKLRDQVVAVDDFEAKELTHD